MIKNRSKSKSITTKFSTSQRIQLCPLILHLQVGIDITHQIKGTI